MKPSEPVQKRYDLLGPRVVKALESRHFEAYYVSTGSEAADLVEKLIPAGNTVGWGGSTTMNELGILDRVKKSHECIDRSLAKDPEEKKAIMKQALTADTFLMSSNAVSEDGILVNIDGVGNRVAALA